MIDFGPVPVGTNSSALSVTVANSAGTAVPITSISFGIAPLSASIYVSLTLATIGVDLLIPSSQASALAAPERFGLGWKAVSFACGLLLLPMATRKWRKLFAAVALLLLAVGGLSSCTGSGGGGGGTPPPTSHTVGRGPIQFRWW
jgi:hypothetical protein